MVLEILQISRVFAALFKLINSNSNSTRKSSISLTSKNEAFQLELSALFSRFRGPFFVFFLQAANCQFLQTKLGLDNHPDELTPTNDVNKSNGVCVANMSITFQERFCFKKPVGCFLKKRAFRNCGSLT